MITGCNSNLLCQLIDSMDYSDIWVYTHSVDQVYPKTCQMIDNLTQFVGTIVSKQYVSDYLMVVIDGANLQDLSSIRKLLHLSKTHDIIVIIRELETGTIMRLDQAFTMFIDYEIISRLTDQHIYGDLLHNREFNDVYQQLADHESIVYDRRNLGMCVMTN